MTIFECKHITKHYKNFTLDDVSFRLESGYLTALIGQNGSGKTTLFQCISGISQKFQGNVFLDQISLKDTPAQYKEYLGFVSETLSYFTEHSILENGQMLGSYFKNWSLEDYYYYLDSMSLPPSKLLYQLSKGELMKMQVAFALAHHPKFLFLDEPMAGFDPVFRRDFLAILQEILAQDIGILLSTHITEDLDKLADYVLVLKDGKLIQNDTKESLEEQYCNANRHTTATDSAFERFHIRDLLS